LANCGDDADNPAIAGYACWTPLFNAPIPLIDAGTMQIRELSELSPQTIESLLRGIPFYKEIQRQDPAQFQRVLQNSKLVELNSGDVIMRAGDRGSWLYFLMKGQLAVLGEGDTGTTPLNYIMPGELFGDLAMLSNCERRATVKADENCKLSLLFATNFASFGEIDDVSVINLETKLVLYRMMVHSVRWKLELNRMDDPEHPLVAEMHRVPVVVGDKGSMKELQALFAQARRLADILIQWNSNKIHGRDLFVAKNRGTITQQLLDDIA
jgi:CRP/FNR family cyclic AMP-dependent transcriptional regulator